MGTPKEVYEPFSNAGLVLKLDPSLLSKGQYAVLTNVESDIEGVLNVRQGTQRCASISIGSVYAYLYSIARLLVSSSSTARYVGIGGVIYRTNSAVGPGMAFTNITGGPPDAGNIAAQRWQSADYGAEGQTQVYKFFATPNGNLKDNGSLTAAQLWGIFPPGYPATASNSGSGTGPPSFTGAEVPYTYVYTYLNGISGAESNPSIVMPASLGVSPNGTAINVVGFGSIDSQVSSLNFYRAGGSFGDGYYRFLGSATNPGSVTSVTFSDTLLDQNILDNNLVETDNDPPVPSGLPVTFYAVSTTTGAAGTQINAHYTVNTAPTGFTPRAGDLLYVATGLNSYETAYCLGYDGTGPRISFYTQLGQLSEPYSIIVTTRTGGACTLALTAFQSIFLAGDPNNPNFLYQSKPNQPESFPVIQQNTGIIQSISVGTPSNPINGIAEYSGAIVCLNLQNIYIVSIYNNQMQSPVASPARHGLITQGAWVKVMNAIWYLSYDGIYSFTGGQETWMSEAIDPLFKGKSMNGYLPINMTAGQGGNTPPTGLDIITMTTVDNNVVMNYTDTSGASMRLVFELNFNRWHIESFYSQLGCTLVAQFTEQDTGYSWIGVSVPGTPYPQPVLDLTQTGTTDGWTTNPTGGTAIPYSFSPTVVDQQAKTDKLFSDIIIETQSQSSGILVNVQYDWSGSNDPTDVFLIPQTTERYRAPFSLQDGPNGPEGKLAYAMQLFFSGNTTNLVNFYTLGIHYEDLTDYRTGLSVDYSDLGYADDKTIRAATVEIDTGGVNCTAYLDVDGQTAVQTFTINTSYYARKVILSVNSFTTGKMVRMRFIAGTGGKANLYGQIAWDYEKLPASLTHFDSDTIAFNWDGYNFVKQVWILAECSSAIAFNLYVDNNTLFWTQAIPAMPVRGTYRFYLPSVNNNVLNKSKVKRFTLDAATPFRMFGAASRLEWLPCGSDQRMDYEQLPLTETMQPE